MKVIFYENMTDDNGLVIFQADIPYLVENEIVENEDGVKVKIDEIWVDHHFED
jgi:hypothetical protein